jgi:hypothetical protein
MNYIYAIQEVGRNRVKIGTTTDLKDRISTLATGNSDELEYIGRWPGDQKVEIWLHGELKAYRRVREWFHITPDHAVDEISRLLGQEPYTDREIKMLARLDLVEADAGETIPHQAEMIRRYESMFAQLQESACENEATLREVLAENTAKDLRIRELEARVAACNSREPFSLTSWRARSAAFINQICR